MSKRNREFANLRPLAEAPRGTEAPAAARGRAVPRARRRGPAPPPPPAIDVEPFTWAERLDVLDALSVVLGGIYVHLPLKRSLYGIDVQRAIEQLRQQVPTFSDIAFHRELTSLVNRLRDAHTQYQGPWNRQDPVASLPFLVESYGPASRPIYVVSKVDRESVPARFRPGVVIEHWNGIPFDRAVDLHAEVETGGRPDARRARALESLTFRSLEYAPPPNEEWVVIGYRDKSGVRRSVRLQWEVLDPGRAPAASRSLASRRRRAINAGAEAVRRAKKFRFNQPLWSADVRGGRRGGADFADYLSCRTVVAGRQRYGYLRVWSFDVEDDDAFLRAVVSKLERLPDRGLVVDLRGNPGGLIWAAERMLQLFTPNPIVPTKFALRATPLTAALARSPGNRSELGPWAESLADAEKTGEPYSSHLPITPEERCNDVGQRYGGPVVLVVDANTYSSGDLFAAGFVDNRIGPVVCVGEATGAGGANVWGSNDLRAALEAAKHPLPPLPPGVAFTVAVRRAVRSGVAEGTLIEDAGVRGQPYEMTHDDVFESNRDLIRHAVSLIASQPVTRLAVRRQGRALRIETEGLDRLHLTVDGQPAGRPLRIPRDGVRRVRIPAGARAVEVVGLASGEIRQRRRLTSADAG